MVYAYMAPNGGAYMAVEAPLPLPHPSPPENVYAYMVYAYMAPNGGVYMAVEAPLTRPHVPTGCMLTWCTLIWRLMVVLIWRSKPSNPLNPSPIPPLFGGMLSHTGLSPTRIPI